MKLNLRQRIHATCIEPHQVLVGVLESFIIDTKKDIVLLSQVPYFRLLLISILKIRKNLLNLVFKFLLPTIIALPYLEIRLQKIQVFVMPLLHE